MHDKILLFVIELLIFLNKYNFINALFGTDVRSFEPNEFPAVVCLFHNNPGYTWSQNMMCTGTLFSSQDVVTSEQCFTLIQNNGFIINAGSHNILESENYYPTWWISYDTWASNVGVNNSNTINDIGVIRIHSSILRARILSMPLNSITPPNLLYGTFVEIVGCGKNMHNVFPAIKQTVAALILTNQECETRTSLVRGEWFSIPNYCLCTLSYPSAFIDKVSHNTYYTYFDVKGDTGGPMVLDDTLVGINVGASPYLNGAYHPNKVNVHLSIDTYRNFLGQMANI